MPRQIGEQEIEDLAIGAAILGTGGGGDPYVGKLLVLNAMRRSGPITLLEPHEVPDDALVIPTAGMGAPTVAVEKIPNGFESYRAMRLLEEHLGRKAFATMPIECGGMNSTVPFVVAAHAGIPVVDADGMGRAFPELQMETFHIYGVDGSPAAVLNERGDACLVRALDNYRLEKMARAIAVRMGGIAHLAEYPMTGKQVKETAIPYTLSLAIRLGAAIRMARHHKQNPVQAIIEVTASSTYGPAIVLFMGKVMEVERRTAGGFVRGKCLVAGIDDYEGRSLEVEFQNENLVARADGAVVGMVPDLITFLDMETGTPITTEGLKYGFRVVCLGIPTPEIMRTPAALRVWGPRYFGLEMDYTPLESLHQEYYARALG